MRISETNKLLLSYIFELLVCVKEWQKDSIKKTLFDFCDETKIPKKQLSEMIRIALTGKVNHLPIDFLCESLGKEETLYRISRLYCIKD